MTDKTGDDIQDADHGLVDNPEGEDLEAAGKGAAKARALAEDHENKAKTEKHLDNGLEETFPASDPVSISPGAD